MKPSLAVLLASAALWGWAAGAVERPFTIRLSFGYKDKQPSSWHGELAVEGGSVSDLRGWKFRPTDSISLGGGWQLRTAGPAGIEPKGVWAFGQADEGAVFRVITGHGGFAFRLSELAPGLPLEKLDGAARVELMPATHKVTDEKTQDDFPSLAVGPDGAVWVAWAAFTGSRDEIRLRRYKDGRWGNFTPVPGTSDDVWMPKIAVDGRGRVWVVWSQRVGDNWDLFARALEGNRWLELIRLTTDPGPDINPALARDSAGNLWVAWQGFRGGESRIFLKGFAGETWSDEIQATSPGGNDWFPAVATDHSGAVWIAWDTYRNGNYDVYMRRYSGGKFSAEIPVATSPRYEAHASIACDPSGRVWVAWESAGANWGKDQGRTIRGHEPGKNLYESRRVGIRCFVNGQPGEPVADISESLEPSERRFLEKPSLVIDHAGRVGVRFRHGTETTVELRPRPPRPGEPPEAPLVRRESYWLEYLTFYEGDRWSGAIEMPNSWGRISMFAGTAVGSDDTIWLAWPSDGRKYENPHQPVSSTVYVGSVKALAAPQEPKLRAPQAEPLAVPAGHATESQDVARVRAYRTTVDGVEQRIARGDLHRHTELSIDSGGRGDGSLLDSYRYMIDAAALDFGAVTDHKAGEDFPYWWWYSQKSADLYYVPAKFMPLFGYERSVFYPHGHRNIIHRTRGVPPVPIFTQPDYRGWRILSLGALEDDTRRLYEEIRRSGGIAIPHTTATGMGTDWRDNDPEVEPVVEIFQGSRNSYESEGAPKSQDPRERRAGYPEGAESIQAAGYVWRAWAKGLRLGAIASSDHVSTHISYAMVYTKALTRETILDGLRKRHTYAATDNIVLAFRIGDHFMGDEFRTAAPPNLGVEVVGTAEISQIDVIKNNRFIYQLQPGTAAVKFSYTDSDIQPGASYYYVRVQQKDGQMAWSSPIWVNYGGRGTK